MDELVQKRLLHAGRGGVPDVRDGSRLTFHFRTETVPKDGGSESQVLDDTRQHKPLELLIGKQFKLEVLEAAVKTMAVSEVAEFTVDKSLLHSYPMVMKTLRDSWDPSKKPAAPGGGHCCGMMMTPNAVRMGYPDLDNLLDHPQSLKFTVELVKVDNPGAYEKESWAMNEGEKLVSVEQLRKSGNSSYTSKQYQEAAGFYSEALGRLESLLLQEKPGDEEWNKLNDIKLPLLLNFSQCKLLEGEHYEVIEHCTTVLKSQPDCVKALFRRGRAHAKVWNAEEARADLKQAAELDPKLRSVVQKELQHLDRLQREKTDQERNVLQGKMFK